MKIIQYLTKFIQLFITYISSLHDEIDSLKTENKTLKRKITSLKKQNKYLKGDFSDNTPETSRTPLYEYFKLDKEAILSPIVSMPPLDFKQILQNGNFKPSKAHLKPNFPNKNQTCTRCNSTCEWHYIHSKTQKRCKLCLKTFVFNRVNNEFKNISIYRCPYCNKKLSFRVSRSAFDVYVCKNKLCSYRTNKVNNIINNNSSLNKRDKISYIYRDLKISIDDVFKFLKDSKMPQPKRNFIFRNFNSKIFSLVIAFKVNLKLSNRDTASAMKDFYNIDISHTTINTYCNMAASLVNYLNYNNKPENISNHIVADETYIKVKGKKHYVWILYDDIYKNVITYHISNKRDFIACATVFLKLLECYKYKPDSLHVMSDMFTAYPMALQLIQKEKDIPIKHTAVKGLIPLEGEDKRTRNAKQKIERVNRVFKESYRITTGYYNIQGARYSFELWMFYYNYMRRENGVFKNKLHFVKAKFNIDNLLIPDKWAYVFNYIKFQLST